jgi:hypothetical protein
LNREHSSPPSIKVTALFGSIALTDDQDLNLRLFTTTGPVVSRPACGGTALDFVCFTLPSPFGPIPFVPVFEVLGFTTDVCSTFSASDA